METTFKKTELNTAARVRRVAIGSIFIGIVMNTTGPLGYLAVLPLLAIYPILTGLFGEDPVDGLLANWQGGFEGECFRPSSRVALLALGGTAIGAAMLSPENVGIRAAFWEYVYVSDADVVVQYPEFLATAISHCRSGSSRAMRRPPMALGTNRSHCSSKTSYV